MKKTLPFFLVSLLLGLSSMASAAEVILGATSTKITTPTPVSYTSVSFDSVFTRTLTVGSYGKDVMALKKIISLEFGTALESGATFTSNTTSDVKKLQEKYAIEILIPNGLSSGTGFVGPSTITKLNQLASKYYIVLDNFTLPIISTEKIYFTTTLQLGSSGDDVSLLKIVLNSDKDTKIVTNSTEVTNIFDLATEVAVNKFQEKYADEILAPSGLTSGTGTVGPATRKKLNFILNNILGYTQTANTSTASSNSSSIPATNSSTNCASLTADIEYAQKDTNDNTVYVLQDFLNRKGYLPVTPTGYFGALTLSAVKAFQSANNINPTGYVGPLTRTKIQDLDCNYTNIITTSAATTPTPTSTILPIANKIDSLAPTITLSANPTQVVIGQSTTLSWNANNTVDQCKITSKDSSGNTYSSTVDSSSAKSSGPINKTTTYTIVCYNKYGIPGSKSIVVEIIDPTKTTAQQITYAQASTITSINPSSGNRGDAVTIKGSGFLSTNNVIFDSTKIENNLILSQSSSSISFKIPEYKSCLLTYCPPPAVDTTVETGGSKIIQVSNTNGFSNDFIFTLPSKIIVISGTSAITPYTPPKLAINYINPTTGNRGDTATIYGSGFFSDSIVFFGGFKVADNLIISKSNNSILFTIPPFQLGCSDPALEICPRLPSSGSGVIIETGGTKDIYIMNLSSKSTSTPVKFTLPSKKITY